MAKKKRKKSSKKKRGKVCSFCFEGHAAVPKTKGVRVAASYLNRNICSRCLALLKLGPRGRFKLVSALEEAARIRGAAQEESR